jgi:hypothetical protein
MAFRTEMRMESTVEEIARPVLHAAMVFRMATRKELTVEEAVQPVLHLQKDANSLSSAFFAG